MKCIKCNQDTGAAWKTLCRTCWKKQTPDEIRAYRQRKLDKKIAGLKKKADKLDILGKEKTAGLEAYRGDIAFFTQPNINSSKGRSFQRYREKLYSKFYDSVQLQIEADKIKDKAEWLEKSGARVKGDAERKRQAEREEMDTVVKVGDIVHSYLYDMVEIVKINKKRIQ
jgi:hypothetical protein